MSETTTIKNFTTIFQKMKLILDIETKLAGEQKQIWAIAIKMGIENKQPNEVILQTLKEQAIDNYNVVADVLGSKLTDEILNFNK